MLMADARVTPATLRLIRIAIATGLLLFGAVAWFVSRQNAPSFDAETAQVFRYGIYGVTLIVFGGLVFLRQRAQATQEPGQRAAMAIAGFALGESVGLLGAVYLLLTDMATFFLMGLAVLALAFLLFPGTPQE